MLKLLTPSTNPATTSIGKPNTGSGVWNRPTAFQAIRAVIAISSNPLTNPTKFSSRWYSKVADLAEGGCTSYAAINTNPKVIASKSICPEPAKRDKRWSIDQSLVLPGLDQSSILKQSRVALAFV